MTRQAIIALLVVLSPCHRVTLSPCHAAEATSAPVTVRGRVVARLYTANAGLSPGQRAELATKRLSALPGGTIAPTEIETRPLNDSVGVYLRGRLLLVATPAEAATRALTPAALADRWATLLRKVLGEAAAAKGEQPQSGQPNTTRTAKPPSPPAPLRHPLRGYPALRLSETSLTLPLGESRTVTVTGSTTTPRVETTGIEVVEAQLAPGSRPGTWALQLSGLTAGRATVRLRLPVAEGKAEAGKAPTAELIVRVMPYAGQLRQPIDVAVTA